MVTLRVTPFALHMRQGKGCDWDLEVEVLEGVHSKVGGVLGETLRWSGIPEQSALRGSLRSYVGDKAQGVVQLVGVLLEEFVVAPHPQQRAVAFGVLQ